MKIAITGHSAGIGKALADCYGKLGHEIVGLSRRNGYDIRNLLKCADVIEPCDMFISNAQSGFAQTELLFEIANRWQGSKKHMVVISTMMTRTPISVLPDMDLYRIQKLSLEEAVGQLRHKQLGIKLSIVRPGNVATSSDKTVPPAADVDNWAQTLVELFEMVRARGLIIPEISLGPIVT